MLFDLTIARFVANGIVATAVHYSVLAALLELAHMRSAGIANGIAAIVGICVSYVGNRIFVFRSRDSILRTFPNFIFVYILVALLHVAVLALWTDYAHLPYSVGFLLATGGAFSITYLGNRYFVFAHSK